MTFISICIAVGPAEEFDTLCASLKSICAQRARNFEIIVKTAGNHLANEIQTFIAREAPMNGALVTGSDTGIYDALNQSVSAATGKYILFIGCGDELADEGVTADIEHRAEQESNPPTMYGQVILLHEGRENKIPFDNSIYFGKRAMRPWRNPCHSQGLIYRRNWLDERPFATNVGPLADLIHTTQNECHKNAIWLDRNIVVFRQGGASNKRSRKAFRGRLKGILANCEYFSPPIFWRVISFSVCHLDYYLRRKNS